MLSGEYKLFVMVEGESLLRPLFQWRICLYKKQWEVLNGSGK
jgi:hypothetical protein